MALVKTFKQLQDDALRWFDEVDDQDELRENVKQAIAAAHAARLGELPWPFMKWPSPVRFTTVAGQREYTLHTEFFRPVYFYNVTQKKFMRQTGTNTFVTAAMGQDDMFRILTDGGEDWTQKSESAYRFELRGLSQVQNQPSTPSVLTVASSSSADGPSQRVRVYGETFDGMTEETIACGASGSQNSGSVQFSKILKVTKLGTWAGTMSLTANSGSTIVLKLFSNEVARQYQTLYLLANPPGGEVIEYHFYRQPNRLVEDNDVPDIPAAFQDILVYDALIDLATYNKVEPDALKIWTARQAMLERGLTNTHGEPTALEREVEYVNYVPRD